MIWKIVFWVSIVFGGWGVISIGTSLTGNIVQDLSSLVSATLSFLGFISMYGFAYKKEIGGRWLAIFTFVVNVSLFLFVVYSTGMWRTNVSDFWDLFFTLLGLGVAWLLFYPLYGYAFKSHDIWRGNT